MVIIINHREDPIKQPVKWKVRGFFVTHMIPGYTELYVIVMVSVYLSLDQNGSEYINIYLNFSVASTCFLDCRA